MFNFLSLKWILIIDPDIGITFSIYSISVEKLAMINLDVTSFNEASLSMNVWI